MSTKPASFLNQKGFTIPVLVIIVLFVLAIPAYFILSSNSVNVSTSKEVRGVSSAGSVHANPGFSVSVTSSSETWDLVEYLCTSLDECTESLASGRRLGTVSGGATELHEVVVEYTSQWKDYDYIKVFVRPGWQAADSDFKVVTLGNVPESEKRTLSDGTTQREVLIFPTAEVSAKFIESAHFSN